MDERIAAYVAEWQASVEARITGQAEEPAPAVEVTNETPNSSPNFSAAAAHVLRGAALAGVALGIQEQAQDRLAKLQTQLVGIVRSHATDPQTLLIAGSNAIQHAYDDLQRSVLPQLDELTRITEQHSRKVAHAAHGLSAGASKRVEASKVLIAGASVPEWLQKARDDAQFKFKAQMRLGLANDETEAQLVQRITGTEEAEANESLAANASLGGIERFLDSAETGFGKLMDSAVQALARAVDDGLYEETDEDEAEQPMGWQWIALLDDRICDRCAGLHGSVWDSAYEPVGESSEEFEEEPPLHPHCRCQLVPVDLSATTVPQDTKLDTFFHQAKGGLSAVYGKPAAESYLRGEISAQALKSQSKKLTLAEYQALLNE